MKLSLTEEMKPLRPQNKTLFRTTHFNMEEALQRLDQAFRSEG